MTQEADVTYAETWTIFAPFQQADGEPAADDLKRIPPALTLNGKTAQPRTAVKSERFDMAPFIGGIKERRTAFVYIEITADRDGEAILGFGADWWHQAWIDGKSVSDTMKAGNERAPITCADHVCRIALSAGKHLLMIRFISGSGGSMLCVGDPRKVLQQQKEEIRRMEVDIALRIKNIPDKVLPDKPLVIPGLREPIALGLTAAQQRLRKECLVYHIREPLRRSKTLIAETLPELSLIDARAAKLHTRDEPWIIWKARKFAARMHEIPFSLDAGERVLGKPCGHDLMPEEVERIREAKKMLTDMTPSPVSGDNGHFHPDYETIFAQGIGGIAAKIQSKLNCKTMDESQHDFYRACEITLRAFSDYIRRMAAACEEQARSCPPERDHWIKLATTCSHIAWDAPRTFTEALQLLQFVFFAAWFGEDHGQSSLGRMDQTLYPFYRHDLETGAIKPQDAFELLCDVLILQNRMQPPGGALPVIVGGCDEHGNDLTNDLSYLCLAAREATKLVYPTVAIAWHEKTPRELMDFAMRMISSGIGDPAFFNANIIAAGLQAHGVTRSDSYNFMNSTCVEIKVAGASNIWVASPYFNCPSYLLAVMEEAHNSGKDPETFQTLCERLRKKIDAAVRDAAVINNETWQNRTRFGLQPFASCIIRDCLERGCDFDQGGARYNWVENSFVGLANLVDSLIVIKELVYEKEELTLAEFSRILRADFHGHEAFREKALNTIAKYGNNLETVDASAEEWANILMDSSERNTVGGHRFVPGFFCWTMHERFGLQTGATPDGRRAHMPFADGAGPAQGRERSGPTSAVLSTTRWSHIRALGGLVHNLKFSKKMLVDKGNRASAKAVIETYLKRGGFEIQVNVVSADTLKHAQNHPEKYSDLIVRVAGYSDYFVNLNQKMQDEVIARTEFETF